MKFPQGVCPFSHPYAYFYGDYCCETEEEKDDGSHAPNCDGSKIAITSLCCFGNKYEACPFGKCVNYDGTGTAAGPGCVVGHSWKGVVLDYKLEHNCF